MRFKILLTLLAVVFPTACIAENIFPIGAIISGSEDGQLLDTVKAGGFNMTWMTGCYTTEAELAKLSLYPSRGLKTIMNYPVHPQNSYYNINRFASGVHYRYQVESDSCFNKGPQYGYADGNYWSSDNRGFMLYWDQQKAYEFWIRRWWLYRNNIENRSPANYGSALYYFDRADYKAVFRLKYEGTSLNDSVCYIKIAKRIDVGSNGDSLYQRDSVILRTSDFLASGAFKPCTLSYYWLNGESRWIDYQIYNYGNYKVSVDYIDIFDAVYDSLTNDEQYSNIYSNAIYNIANIYDDTSVVYRFYMFDEPVRSQLDAYRLVDDQLKNSGTGVRGIATTLASYPCSFGNIGYSSMADTTYYYEFVQKTSPAQLLINVIPIFGDSGNLSDAIKDPDRNTYRTPVDSGFYLQTQYDIMAKYCRAGLRACKLTDPETPLHVLLQSFGDSLLDANGTPVAEGRWRLPTPRELKCMAYLSLAHGAKGLHYGNFTVNIIDYTVWGAPGKWKQASISDDHGNIQHPELFTAIKEINGRVNAWSNILLNLVCDQTFRKQNEYVPSESFITGVSDSLVQVGLFHSNTNINDKYFMLVNRHCLSTDTLTVTVNISNAEPFFITDMLTGQPASGQLPAGAFSYKLQPGEGRLFRLVPFTAKIKINQNAAYTNFRFVQVDNPANSSLHSLDSVQVTQKYYVKAQEDTAARPDYIDYYWAADTSPWLPYSISTIKYLENSIDNKANIFELQFKIGEGKILTPKYAAQIFFNDVFPANGAITINNGETFTNSQTVNVKLSGTDLFPGLAQMRFAENPFGSPIGYVNLVQNGCFDDTTKWALDNAEYYGGFLHLKGYNSGPCPTQFGSSAKQIIPGSEINPHRNKLFRLTDDIYSHNVISSYKFVDVFYTDSLSPNGVRLLEKPIASEPEIVWKSESDTFTLKVDTTRAIDRMEISYNIWGIEIPPNPPDPGTLFNTIVVDNICLEPVELKTGAQPDILPPSIGYIYDGWDYADTAYSWCYKLSDGDGTKRVYFQLKDLAGNTSLCPGWSDTIVLDMTSPVTGISSPIDMTYVNGTVCIKGYAWDLHFANWVLEFKKINTGTWGQLSSGISPIHYKLPQTLCLWNTETVNDGLYLLRQTGYDLAGNVGSDTIYVYVANNTLPREAVNPDFAVFNSLPVDGTTDSEGNIYATDTQADKIWKFSPDGESLLCFGYKYTGADTLGLNHPKGIAVDDSGNIWVTDCYQSKVKKYDNQSNYLSALGKHGNKQGEFNQPTGIAINGNEIYVVDHLNGRVQVFSQSGAFLRQFGSNSLNQPTGIAINRAGLIYVSDSKNNRIAIFDTLGAMVDSLGYDLGLREPWDVCFDCNDNLFIADVYNNRIVQLDAWGNKLLAFGTQGKEAGEFKLPQGLAVSPDGKYVYVIDTHNDRIQRFKMFFDLGTAGPQLAGRRKSSVPPISFMLGQCYPNPSSVGATISYALPKQSMVKLNIYNTLGQKVISLVNENQMPGYYSIKWDAKDDAGKKAATGVYFYRLEADEYSAIKKMVVVR